LIPIFGPGALSVVWRASLVSEAISAKNLNFSINAATNYSRDSFGETAKLYDWMFFSVNPARANGDPVYGGASTVMLAIAYQTAYGGQILPGASPCGANCTFEQSFMGPSYKCTSVAPAYNGTIPYFWARNSTEDFCQKYPSQYTIGGNCTWSGTDDEWQDGVLTVDYVFTPLQDRANETNQGDIKSYNKYAYRCEQWRTAYAIRRTYQDSIQTINYNFTYLSRIPYWPVMHHGQQDFQQATSYDYVPPPTFDPAAYFGNLTLPISDNVGYAIHQTLYSMLRGKIYVNAHGDPITTTRIGGTQLVETTVWPPKDGIQKPKENFGPLLEELSRNVTLSLFSIDNLVYAQVESPVFAVESPYQLVFHYNRLGLWLTYGIAIAVGIAAALVGIVSFVANGVSMDTGFLTILSTTRGRRIDEITEGCSLGAQPLPQDLRDTKMMFGEIAAVETEFRASGSSQSPGSEFRTDRRGHTVGHAGFGMEGEVQKLAKGRAYI
jgi:hypothetical protein